jgi:3-oxoisoapionate kinase
MNRQLLVSFYGDDFTGSTDAMESLARNGLRTVLFTSPPTRQQLEKYPDLHAFGVAGMTRSMRAEQMEAVLRPAFASLRESGAPIIHYKVCSTFDSSPQIGSIGRVIDIAAEVFGSCCVPLLVGAPPLGRYCVFGNLFARFGADGELFRLDRHPSISRHPVTPMDEADLCVHLAKQTKRKIGLLNILDLDRADVDAQFDQRAAESEILLIDMLRDNQLATAGRLIERRAQTERPLFVVGSSAIEMALGAHWNKPASNFGRVTDAGPIVAICGSCSPVTAGQVRSAIKNGFVEISDLANASAPAIIALQARRSVVIHSQRVDPAAQASIGQALGNILRTVLSATKVRRVIVAGGDTSGEVARALGIESMEMIGELTRGSPLCRATAPASPADGIEITFKGGQIGPEDFFSRVQRGE